MIPRRRSVSGRRPAKPPSGRLWLDLYPEHARAVCVDGKGWLVASVELPMQGLSRPRRLRQVVKAVRGLVERLPEGFKAVARRQGFELRGVQPFLRFRKELETQTGFPIRVTESGGCDHDRAELHQLQARHENLIHVLSQPQKGKQDLQRLKDLKAETEARIRHLEKRLAGAESWRHIPVDLDDDRLSDCLKLDYSLLVGDLGLERVRRAIRQGQDTLHIPGRDRTSHRRRTLKLRTKDFLDVLRKRLGGRP